MSKEGFGMLGERPAIENWSPKTLSVVFKKLIDPGWRSSREK